MAFFSPAERVNPCFVISHSLHRQNLSGLLPFFTHVSISAFVGNLASLKNLLTYFGFEPEEKQRYKQLLVECTTPYCHLVLDVQKMTIEMKTVPLVSNSTVAVVSNTKGSAAAKRKLDAQKSELVDGRLMTKKDAQAHASAAHFLGDKLVKNGKKARALFQLIYSRLPKKNIDPDTLNMNLKRSSGRGRCTVSLIDYVATLVDSKKEPTEAVAKFHQYCIKHHNLTLPTVYLVNKRFW